MNKSLEFCDLVFLGNTKALEIPTLIGLDASEDAIIFSKIVYKPTKQVFPVRLLLPSYFLGVFWECFDCNG